MELKEPRTGDGRHRTIDVIDPETVLPEELPKQEPKIEKFTIADVYGKYKRIGELLETARTIPDSHWREVDDVVDALTEVENYLEGNIGSED